MYQSSVVYDLFKLEGNKYIKSKSESSTQMDFLKLLIHGIKNANKALGIHNFQCRSTVFHKFMFGELL